MLDLYNEFYHHRTSLGNLMKGHVTPAEKFAYKQTMGCNMSKTRNKSEFGEHNGNADITRECCIDVKYYQISGTEK